MTDDGTSEVRPAFKVEPEERRGDRRKPLRSVSAKRAKTNRERAKLKIALVVAAGVRPDGSWSVSRVCAGRALVPEVECSSPYGSRPRVEMHEIVKRGRWPKGAIVRSNCVLLCQAHHDFTEAEPAKATAVGLLARAANVHPFDKFDPSPRESE